MDSTPLNVYELYERLGWARSRGHPLYIWPEIPLIEWRNALLHIERIASEVLRGEATVELEMDDDAFVCALTIAAFTSGMGPLLGWWVEQGVLRVGKCTRQLLELHLAHGRKRAQAMRQTLRAAVAALEGAGIPVTVIKGAHTAFAYFAEPGLRPMADLDLLVDASHVAAAETAFLVAGYRQVPGTRLRRPYRSDWRPDGVSEDLVSVALHHADNPYSLDLHASLEVSFFGVRSIRLDRAFAHARLPAPWASPTATALAPPLNLAYQAAHASRGLYNLTLIRLMELVFMIRNDTTSTLDWTELTDGVRRAGAERFVYPAFELAERLAPNTLDPRFQETLQRAATRTQHMVMTTVSPGTAQRIDRISLREQFMWAATPLEYAGRAVYMLLPIPDTGSLRKFLRVYLERVFRLLRARVQFRTDRQRH